MKRRVLVIPVDEIREHFRTNSRQDIKTVAPEILSEELYQRLVTKNKNPEKEDHLQSIWWKHSPAGKSNLICEAKDFIDKALPQYPEGPFGLAFANQHAAQDEHYHLQHLELYYSESPMTARYCLPEANAEEEPINLPEGGVIIFGPKVAHTVDLKGLTIVIEFSAVANDKKDEKIRKGT